MIRRLTTLLLFGCLAAGCGGVGKSQAQLRTAVDAQKPTLNDCYKAALTRDKTTAGSMEVTLHLAEKSGKVEQVDFDSPAVGDSQLQECVRTAIVGVQVEPKPKANLVVAYTVQFTPETN